MITATLYHGSLPLILSSPIAGDGDSGTLDAMDWEILCESANWRFDLSSLGFNHRDKIPGYFNMWVVSSIPRDEDGTRCIVTVSAIGCMTGAEKRKRAIGSAGQQIALGPEDGKEWVDPAGTTSDKWNIRDRMLTVTDTYFTNSEPVTSVVGSALAPPVAPGTPAFLWGHLSLSWRANYPKGWVLDDRQIIEHFKNSATEGLWEVRDTFGYYQIATPE